MIANKGICWDTRVKYFMPVIYGIYNTTTRKYYIGRTSQRVTARWFAHIYQMSGAGDKFCEDSFLYDITHWAFMVLEEVEVPDGLANVKEIDEYTSVRECYWIDKLNTIKSGYNTKYPIPAYRIEILKAKYGIKYFTTYQVNK